MKREELIKTKEYWIAQLQTKLFETLEDFLSENEMTQTQFAENMGVTKGYVSQILNGDFDHKISKFVELLMACGKVPIISIKDLDEVVSIEKSKSKKAVSATESKSSNPKALKKIRA